MRRIIGRIEHTPVPAIFRVLISAAIILGWVTARLYAQEWQFLSGEYNSAVYGDGGEIIVVGEAGLILRSADSGANWELPRSGTYWTLRDVVRLGEGSYLAVGDGGTILRSDDGGKTWWKVQGNTDVRFRAIAVPETNRIYLLGSGGRVFRSTDGGTTWGEMPMLPEEADGFACANNEVGVAVCSSGTVYRTADGGVSWTEVYRDTAVQFHDVDFSPDGGLGFVSGSASTALRTTDTGKTWARSSLWFPLDGLCISLGEGGRVVVSGRGDQQPVRAMVGRSMDSGRTWETVVFPFPQDITYVSASKIVLGRAGRAVAVTNGGCIYRTEDDWKTVIPVTQLQHKWGDYNKAPLNSPAFGTEAVGIIPHPMFPGGYVRTTDGGITWLAGQIGGGRYTGANFYSATGALMIRNDVLEALVRTGDGGKTWAGWHAQTERATGYVRGMRFLDSLHGVQVGTTDLLSNKAKGFFYRTTDGGQTFQGMEFDHPKILHLVEFVSPSVGWIGGSNPALVPDSAALGYSYGAVYRTTDGGETWRSVYDRYGVYAEPFLLRFRDEKYGVIGVGGAEYGYPNDVVLLETIDGGDTWSVKARFPMTEAPAALVFLNDTLWCAVGGNLSIWETADAGVTWRREEINPLPRDSFARLAYLSSITLLPDEKTVVASGPGVLMRRVFPQKVTGVKQESSERGNMRALTLVPNPASGIVRILGGEGTAISNYGGTVTLYDLSGRAVLSRKIESGTTGSMEVDASAFSSGTYRVLVRDESRTIVGEATLVIVR